MNSFRFLISCVMVALGSVSARPADACTSYIVTKQAATDGSTMVTYAADSVDRYGNLDYWPAGNHPPGAIREIHDFETGKYLGQIPEAPHTYAVVGNMNEHQLTIAETSFDGRPELINPQGQLDYGSLIYVTLQRARTARAAIQTMAELTLAYGYRSDGETYSIGDPNEAWIMEMVGKGPGQKGTLWVARRVPQGYVTAHSNRSRIRQFPQDDPANNLYAQDVISYARTRDWYSGQDQNFSFAAAYAPPTAHEMRAETRVWALFRRIAPSAGLPEVYRPDPLDGSPPPLPLWVKPDRKLSAREVMALMRDHFEGTALDLTQGIGAGPYALPYRARPLTWTVDRAEYAHERPVSVQQTGFSFVAQARAALPDPVGGLLWFGVDDTYSTVYVPMYCGIREAPRPFAAGTGSFQEFSWESAFWVFNFVSNFSYLRYRDMIRDIQKVQQALESGFLARQDEVEATAVRMYRDTPELARDYLTRYSAMQSNETVSRWRKLGESLLVKYLDGNVRDPDGHVQETGYPEPWRRRLTGECGERCRVPDRGHKLKPSERKPAALTRAQAE